jgi:uncharacterized cupredoxin-like copper-binding protein
MKVFAGKWVLIPALLLMAGVACSTSSGTGAGTLASSVPTAGGTIGIGLKQWAISPTAAKVSAGTVTFNVDNQGNITHEFVVLRTDTPSGEFTIGSFENEPDRIDEDHDGTNVGETGDLAAGALKAITITLTPGHYVFVCNLPGHYHFGMHTDFTVS